MTEIAGRQMLNGDIDKASDTLKKVNHYAQLIHMDLASNSKRIQERRDAHAPHHLSSRRIFSAEPPVKIETRSKPPSNNSIRFNSELLAEVLKH